MAELMILNQRDIESILTLDKVIPVVEEAFRAHAQNKARIFPIVRELVNEHQAVFGIKSGFIVGNKILGLKAGGFWHNNRNYGREPHQSTVVLFDPESGFPYLLANGNLITQLRTAAAGAIALMHLSPPNPLRAAIIGAGMQGKGQAQALLSFSADSLEEIRVFDINPESSKELVNEIRENFSEIKILQSDSVKEAVLGANVIITCTPSNKAIVKSEWISPGTHISAFGADTKGKQELDEKLFKQAKIVVDDISQAIEIGETQHAISTGLITTKEIHATLGQLILDNKLGRKDDSEITIFDATGIALQDLVTAQFAFELAHKRGMGTKIIL